MRKQMEESAAAEGARRATGAAALGSYAYRTITNILRSAQDQLPLEVPEEPSTTPPHANIRGATYYTPSKEDAC